MVRLPDWGKWLVLRTVASGLVSRFGQVVRFQDWQVVIFPDCDKWLGFKIVASG